MNANTATAVVTALDAAGNGADVDIVFPVVDKGDQTLSGFKYSATSITFGNAAPSPTAPTGAENALSYAAAPALVCSVDPASGVLTIAGAGVCTITATAASSDNYNEAAVTFDVTVLPAGTLALNLDDVTDDNTINIAEKAAGFTISGNTGSEGGATVTLTLDSTELTATSSSADPAVWSVSVPADAAYITGESVAVTAAATKIGFNDSPEVQRSLTVDLTAPTAPTYAAPETLKVGEEITAMNPSGGVDIVAREVSGLPSGLVFDVATGIITGTPDTADANTATATVTVTDAAGNTAAVDIALLAVDKGDQTLTGFAYSATTANLVATPPTLTAPTGALTVLAYSAAPDTVCTVDADTGALTVVSAGECTITATAAADANYNEATATFVVTVLGDVPGVLINPGSLTLDEGESATYTVVLRSQPTGSVTVSVSGTEGTGLVPDKTELNFGESDWNEPQEVTLTASHDGDAENDVVRILHEISGAEYLSGGVVSDPLTVTVEDDDTPPPALALSVNPASVGEGAGATDVTVTARIDGEPAGEPVSVFVSVGAADDAAVAGVDFEAAGELNLTIPAGETSAAVTFSFEPVDDFVDERVKAISITGAVDSGNFEVFGATLSIADDDERGVAVGAAALTVDEGDDATYTVALSSEPTGAVTVTPAASGDADVTVSAALTFTASDWNEARTVTISAAHDDDAADDAAAITHSIAGADYGANEVTANDVTVSVTDDEAAVVLTLDPAAVDEGAGTATVTVTATLDGETRSEPVVLTVDVGAAGDSAVAATDYAAVEDLSLTIAAGASSGAATFTFAPVDDRTVGPAKTVSITGVSGIEGLEVTGAALSITDNDERGVTVGAAELSVTEGGSATYTVALATRPDADVTVTPSSPDNADLGFAPAALTFTAENWQAAQTVTVTAMQDSDAEDDIATIQHEVSGADYGRNGVAAPAVPLTVEDNDALVTLAVNPALVSEGAEATAVTVTATLDGAARSEAMNFTLRVGAAGDTATAGADYAAVDNLALAIPAGGTSGQATFTFTPSDDLIDEPGETISITATTAAAGVAVTGAGLTIADNDVRGIVVSTSELTVIEGESASWTVALATRPTGNVTVTPTLSGSPDLRFAPSNLTFTRSNWNQPQSLSATAIEDEDANHDSSVVSHTASGADYDSLTGGAVAATISDNDVTANNADVPAQVANLRAQTTIGHVDLNWDAVAGTVLGYRVEASYDGGANWALVNDNSGDTHGADGPATTYRHAVALEFAETRRYRVSAVGENGPGLPSTFRRVSATGTARGLTADVFSPADAARAIGLCWRPQGLAASELSDVAVAWTTALSAASTGISELSWQSAATSDAVDCAGGIGVRVPPVSENQRYSFRMRAKHDGAWLVSDAAEAVLVDTARSLRAIVTAGASGLSGDTPVPALLCRNYDDPATLADEQGAFYVSVGFTTADAQFLRYEPVELNAGARIDIENATWELLPRPLDTRLGYRLKITPTVWGEPVSISLPADIVSHGESGVGNEASDVFRRETSAALDCNAAPAEPLRRAQAVSVRIDADGDRSGEWAAGELIRVRMRFDERVEVAIADGVPGVTLALGQAAAGIEPARVTASYASVANGDTLVFEHLVTAAEAPVRDITLVAGSLALNGGRIDSYSGPAVDLSHEGASVVGGEFVQPDLTASWSAIPGSHEGADSHFELRLRFSEDADVTVANEAQNLIDYAFTVTNGVIEAIEPARDGQGEYRADEWTLRVAPDSDEPVTVAPAVERHCGAAGAICTIDDRSLKTAPAVTVYRIAQSVSVAEAEVGEGPGAMLAFEVTLVRAAEEAVTVDYATADGSAVAGEDYEAASGTLTIAAGQTAATVHVTVLDDSHDEGEETLTLTLSNAVNAAIGNGEALGVIVNSDPIPGAWLSRFGRAASDHVAQAVSRRMDRESNEEHFTVGRFRLDSLFTDSASGTAAAPAQMQWNPLAPGANQSAPLAGFSGMSGYSGGQSIGSGSGSGIGNGSSTSAADPSMLPAGNAAQWSGGSASAPLAGGSPTQPNLRDALLGSSFNYTFDNDGDAADTSAGALTAWGETATTRFQGGDGALSLDGDVTTAVLGLDKEYGRWLVGANVSHSLGNGGYRASGAAGGVIESTLTSLNPYAHYRLNETTDLWGVIGFGRGTLRLTPEGAGEAIETELSNRMLAFGGRGLLSARGGEAGRFELALRSDALLTHTDSAAVTGLAGAAGSTGRARLLLEGSGSLPLWVGVLRPTLEAGLRYDGGDAETGAGFEVGGGLGYTAGDLSVEVNGRGLLAHEDSAYREWGFSSSLAWAPGQDGRGISMRVGSAWGATQSGVQSLWSRADASGLASGAAMNPAQRFQFEFGYGFEGSKRESLWAPYMAAETGQGGNQLLRMGLKFTSGSRFEAGFEFGQRMGGPGRTEQAVELRGVYRW